MASGHTAVTEIRKITGALPTPTATITMGAHANGEIILRKFTMGVVASSNARKNPKLRPSGMPMPKAISSPLRRRPSDARMSPNPFADVMMENSSGTESAGPIFESTGLFDQNNSVATHHRPIADATAMIFSAMARNFTGRLSRGAQKMRVRTLRGRRWFQLHS